MKKLFFIFVVSLMFLQFISAIDTEVKVNTLSNHTLRLNFLDPDRATSGKISFETDTSNTGETGEVSYIFSNPSSSFDLAITLLKDGQKLIYELVEDVTASETLQAIFIPGAIEINKDYQESVVEEVQVEESLVGVVVEKNLTDEVVDESLSEDSGTAGEQIKPKSKFSILSLFKIFKLSGFASSEEDGSLKKFLYYGGGFIFLLVIIFLIFMKLRKKHNDVDGSQRKFKDDDEEIEDAERKLEEAREEIREVRRNKIGI